MHWLPETTDIMPFVNDLNCFTMLRFDKSLATTNFFIPLSRVSLIRPAPIEPPQVRKEARADG